MTAKLNPKNVDLLFILALVAVAVGAYAALFHNGVTRYFFLKTQEKLLQESLEASTAVDTTLLGMQNEIQSVQKKLDEFNSRLPKKENIDEILKQISDASVQTGVGLELIEPLEISESEMYRQLPIKIYFQSRFKNCYGFLSRMEGLPRILQLDGMTIEKKSAAGDLEIQMLISAFMLK